MDRHLTNTDLGYDEYFEHLRVELGLSDLPVARVVAEHKGAYQIREGDEEFRATVTGKDLYEAQTRADLPVVGDWVAFLRADDEHAVIHAILPRRTLLARSRGDRSREGGHKDIQPIAANIDRAFIVGALDRDYVLHRFERYVALARASGVQPIIVINKKDLLSEEDQEERLRALKEYFPGTEIVFTSTQDRASVEDLRTLIVPGKTSCFLGSSGVGKSSLINMLAKEILTETASVSTTTGRGKHTTTARQLFVLQGGGIVVDNPGIREIGMVGSEGEDSSLTERITLLAHACRFRDCTHTHEPGCAVRRAVEEEVLDEEQLAHIEQLKKEQDFLSLSHVERRNKDKKFGRMIKRTLDDLRDHQP